mmetsp:Transcript_3335/g.8022  ORF Transcript_3335/g.8022 Transcript_3335/m.8022 type:complete len:243 (-) Transcript_3335:1568-2296(-)
MVGRGDCWKNQAVGEAQSASRPDPTVHRCGRFVRKRRQGPSLEVGGHDAGTAAVRFYLKCPQGQGGTQKGILASFGPLETRQVPGRHGTIDSGSPPTETGRRQGQGEPRRGKGAEIRARRREAASGGRSQGQKTPRTGSQEKSKRGGPRSQETGKGRSTRSQETEKRRGRKSTRGRKAKEGRRKVSKSGGKKTRGTQKTRNGDEAKGKLSIVFRRRTEKSGGGIHQENSHQDVPRRHGSRFL